MFSNRAPQVSLSLALRRGATEPFLPNASQHSQSCRPESPWDDEREPTFDWRPWCAQRFRWQVQKAITMADIRFVRPNRLRQDAYRRRAWIVGVGLPLAAMLAVLHPTLTAAVLFTMAFLWNRQERFLKGALGEDRALGDNHLCPGALVHLSDEYVVFNQVPIPNIRGRPYEADFVVVGPNGIFVIETKYYCGLIQGRENDSMWARLRPGSQKSTSVANPALQVRRAMRALAAHLRECGIRVWLEPLVVVTHPTSRLVVDSRSIPVLTLHELASHIREHRPTHAVTAQVQVIDALRKLVDGGGNTAGYNPAPRVRQPMPIGYFMQDYVTNRVESVMTYDLKAALRRERWKQRLGLAPQHQGSAPANVIAPPHRAPQRVRIHRTPAGFRPLRRTRRRIRIVERKVEWLEEASDTDHAEGLEALGKVDRDSE